MQKQAPGPRRKKRLVAFAAILTAAGLAFSNSQKIEARRAPEIPINVPRGSFAGHRGLAVFYTDKGNDITFLSFPEGKIFHTSALKSGVKIKAIYGASEPRAGVCAFALGREGIATAIFDGKDSPKLKLISKRDTFKVALSPDGQRIAALAGDLIIIDRSGKQVQVIKKPVPTQGWIDLNWSPSGKYLAFVTSDATRGNVVASSPFQTYVYSFATGKTWSLGRTFSGVKFRLDNDDLQLQTLTRSEIKVYDPVSRHFRSEESDAKQIYGYANGDGFYLSEWARKPGDIQTGFINPGEGAQILDGYAVDPDVENGYRQPVWKGTVGLRTQAGLIALATYAGIRYEVTMSVGNQ